MSYSEAKGEDFRATSLLSHLVALKYINKSEDGVAFFEFCLTRIPRFQCAFALFICDVKLGQLYEDSTRRATPIEYLQCVGETRGKFAFKEVKHERF